MLHFVFEVMIEPSSVFISYHQSMKVLLNGYAFDSNNVFFFSLLHYSFSRTSNFPFSFFFHFLYSIFQPHKIECGPNTQKQAQQNPFNMNDIRVFTLHLWENTKWTPSICLPSLFDYYTTLLCCILDTDHFYARAIEFWIPIGRKTV